MIVNNILLSKIHGRFFIKIYHFSLLVRWRCLVYFIDDNFNINVIHVSCMIYSTVSLDHMIGKYDSKLNFFIKDSWKIFHQSILLFLVSSITMSWLFHRWLLQYKCRPCVVHDLVKTFTELFSECFYDHCMKRVICMSHSMPNLV